MCWLGPGRQPSSKTSPGCKTSLAGLQMNRIPSLDRTGVPIQDDDVIMGVLSAVASAPIGAKHWLKAGSVPIRLCCDLLNQLNWHYNKYIPLHEPHPSSEWTFYITMEMIVSRTARGADVWSLEPTGPWTAPPPRAIRLIKSSPNGYLDDLHELWLTSTYAAVTVSHLSLYS
jgi:hypothetical protein